MEIVYGSIWFCEFMNIMNKSRRFEYWFRMLYWNVGKAFEWGPNFSGACIARACIAGA
jgi:hypothetical protein